MIAVKMVAVMVVWTDGCSDGCRDGCSGVLWHSDGTVRAYGDGMHAAVYGDGEVTVCADMCVVANIYQATRCTWHS